MEEVVKRVRQASIELASLSTEQKNQALEVYVQVLEEKQAQLISENQRDLKEQKGKISPSLYQRLELSAKKLKF